MIILKNGISVGNFSIVGTKVSGFYLTLDKKLILKIDEILVASDDNKKSDFLSKERLNEYINDAFLIIGYFQSIEIQKIQRGEEHLSLLYDKEHFFIRSDRISIETKLAKADKLLSCDIELGKLHKENISFGGNMVFDTRSQKLTYEFGFLIDGGPQGALSGWYQKDKLAFRLDTGSFVSTDFLQKIVEFENENIKPWIYENVKAESLQIENLSGILDFKHIDKSLSTIAGDLRIQKPYIHFNPDLPPVIADSCVMHIKEGSLYFDIVAPVYEGIALDPKSSVSITNIFGESEQFLNLHLIGKEKLDERILKVLRAYKIKLPLYQHNSYTDADVTLAVNLEGYDTTARGVFHTEDTNLSINSFDFFAQKVDAILKGSDIEIVSKNARIKDYFTADLNMSVRTREYLIKGVADIQKFHIKTSGEEVANIQNLSTGFTIDFHDGVALEVPRFGLLANFKETNSFALSDISKVYAYSELLKNNHISSGKGRIRTDDFETFLIDGDLDALDTPLLNKEGTPLTRLSVKASVTKNKSIIESADKKIYLEIADENKFAIDGYDINVTHAMQKKDTNNTKTTHIRTAKSDLYIGQLKIPSQDLSGVLNKDTHIVLRDKGGYLNIDSLGTTTFLNGYFLKDSFMNTVIKRESFKKGTFDIDATYKNSVLKGILTINNSTLKELSVLSNTIAFIDTIPSLVIFKNPGFNDDGYEIDKGTIQFGYGNEVLVFEDINIKGHTLDITGSGVIDFEADKIDIILEISTIKSLTSILGAIPIANYILLGKDNKATTRIRIQGAIDNPQISSSALQDTLSTPFEMIERTLKTPLRIFGLE